MPRCKLSHRRHLEKQRKHKERKVANISSKKVIMQSQSFKEKEQCHKPKETSQEGKSGSIDTKKIVSVEPEVITLHSSSGSDTDISIIYDSKSDCSSKLPSNSFGNSNKVRKSCVRLLDNLSLPKRIATASGNSQEGIKESLTDKHSVSEKPSTHSHSVTQKSAVHTSQLVVSEGHKSSITTVTGVQSTSQADRESSILQREGTGKRIDKRKDSRWIRTKFGEAMENGNFQHKEYLMFDVVSYNVLSQAIMEEHPYLYSQNNPTALNWEYRSALLLNEFRDFNAAILCLQEVQENHIKPFYNKLHDLGYSGIYKQRTGNKVDGVAIYFKKDIFQLIDHATVEYFQPGVSLLNRDNVGLVAKFAPKMKPDERIVVATTHLLFNPRRHDVKLAQIQLLLAEIDRFAFRGFDPRTGASKYWPIILAGDMNFEPNTGEYQLLNMGWFQYEGRCSKTLSFPTGRPLQKELIPQYLGVTDTCQHWNIVKQRQMTHLEAVVKYQENHTLEVPLIKTYNTDHRDKKACSVQLENPLTASKAPWSSFLSDGCEYGFGTGQLSHTLNLNSVYLLNPNETNKSQVTTFQNDWVVVDYIFYSNIWHPNLESRQEGNLKLVARYKLFSAKEARALGPIPNLNSPSDHYPLIARFALVF